MSEPDWLRTAREKGLLGKVVPVNPEWVTGGRAAEAASTPALFDGMSEAEWQEVVLAEAQSLGWLVAHFRKVRVQRADGSVYWETPAAADGAGYPDLHLVRGRASVFVELKTDKGARSEAQVEWARALTGAGCRYFVWRPRHWASVRDFLRTEG